VNNSSTYTGSACQFATFENLQTRAVFVDDTNPAISSLTGPRTVVNGAATFSFSAAADPTFRLFECRVAGVHEWQTCSSGRSEDPPTGSYTFQVRAVDWSGNRSTESTWNWTVDKVAPETTLQSAPSGTVASTGAQFTFSTNESGTFLCSLDGATPTACGSPKSYSGLAQGEHTFSVTARDVAGNPDPTPATATWTVDTVAPETTLATSGPTGSTTATTAQFDFASADSGATFTCQLDGGAVELCVSPRSYSGLGVGEHTFTVRARDAAGNTDASPATRTWTVVAPAVEPIDPGGGSTTTPQPTTTSTATTTPPPLGGGTTTVTSAPPPAAQAAINGRTRATRRASRTGRFTLPNTVTCPAACKVSVRATAKRRIFAKTSFTLLEGGKRAIKLKLTKKGRAALKRAKKARLVVRIRLTPAGSTTALVKTVRLTLKLR
jgi:hypothetical protein